MFLYIQIQKKEVNGDSSNPQKYSLCVCGSKKSASRAHFLDSLDSRQLLNSCNMSVFIRWDKGNYTFLLLSSSGGGERDILSTPIVGRLCDSSASSNTFLVNSQLCNKLTAFRDYSANVYITCHNAHTPHNATPYAPIPHLKQAHITARIHNAQ